MARKESEYTMGAGLVDAETQARAVHSYDKRTFNSSPRNLAAETHNPFFTGTFRNDGEVQEDRYVHTDGTVYRRIELGVAQPSEKVEEAAWAKAGVGVYQKPVIANPRRYGSRFGQRSSKILK